jgi:hypothetical protein
MNRKRFWWLLLAVGVLAGAPWAVTHAVFTDTQAVTGNTFSTGSVDISTSPTSALVTFSGMVPGDKVTAPLTVSNAGTLQLRYAMSTSITGSTTLSDGLTLGIKSGVTTCTNAGFATDGTSVYTTGTSLTSGAIGSNAQGAQTGDRTLNASASEILCFQVSLPSGSSSSLQGLTTTATFTFDAEQTTNNP